MDPYGVNMLPGGSMIAHIALLHMSMEVHAQDPYSEFHSTTVRAQRLLGSLPPVAPWVASELYDDREPRLGRA